MLLAEFGTGQVFWSILWFSLWFILIWLVIIVIVDIFRSRDLSGWSKALWTILVIFLPFLGLFVYLISRGHRLQENSSQAADASEAMLQRYAQSATGSTGLLNPADEIRRLMSLRDFGIVSEAEFQEAKAKASG